MVSANPANRLAVENNRGNIIAANEKNDTNIIKNALLILFFVTAYSNCEEPLLISSVIIIWSSTDIPILAIIPAILGMSNVQCIAAATPITINISVTLVRSINEEIL